MDQQIHIRIDKSFSIPIKKKSKVRNKKITKKSQTRITFQDSMRPALITAQVLSLMPFDGVLSKNSSDVKFKIASWKCLYCVLSLLGQIFITALYAYDSMNSEANLNSIIPIIFNGTVCCIMLMYFQIARSWPALVQDISQTEELNPDFDNKLVIKSNVTFAVIMTLTSIEQILYVPAILAKTSACYHREPDSYEEFLTLLYPLAFKYCPYSLVLGLVTQFLQLQAYFIRNYSDLFLICISYYLTSRLEQVNKTLKAAQGKYLPEMFWRSAREKYYRATQLVRKVDDVISGIVFITFANNLLSICLQLYNTLQDGIKRSSEYNDCSNKNTLFNGYNALSFLLFSLVYLVTRSIAIFLSVSQINTASLVPASVLYEVPSPVYCDEVERFLDQVNGDKVALSGLQFFSVTRGLLLTVTGTIVTYELVLLQLGSPVAQDNITELFFPNMTTTAIP